MYIYFNGLEELRKINISFYFNLFQFISFSNTLLSGKLRLKKKKCKSLFTLITFMKWFQL